MENPSKKKMEYPFSFIQDETEEPLFSRTIDAFNDWRYGCQDYKVKAFAKGLLDEEVFDVGNFPENITEYYWIHEGTNDEDAWQLFCQIATPSGPAYAYYTASCDYTGFDCQGGMTMVVSKSAEALFEKGLTDRGRTLFLEEKQSGQQKPIPEWKMPVAEPPTTISENPTRAFIRLWINGKETPLSLDYVDGLQMEDLEYSIRGLTATFLTPKPTVPVKGRKPQKKFFLVDLLSGYVTGIDDIFKKRFKDSEKRWPLRVSHRLAANTWEVSFLLC